MKSSLRYNFFKPLKQVPNVKVMKSKKTVIKEHVLNNNSISYFMKEAYQFRHELTVSNIRKIQTKSWVLRSFRYLHIFCIKIHSLSAVWYVDLKAPQEFWNPLSKTVSRKFHWSVELSNCDCLQDRANLRMSRALQIVLIFTLSCRLANPILSPSQPNSFKPTVVVIVVAFYNHFWFLLIILGS